MELSITGEEREMLGRLVDSHIRDLRSEVYHAESHAVKEELRDREATARRLRDKLRYEEEPEELPVT